MIKRILRSMGIIVDNPNEVELPPDELERKMASAGWVKESPLKRKKWFGGLIKSSNHQTLWFNSDEDSEYAIAVEEKHRFGKSSRKITMVPRQDKID